MNEIFKKNKIKTATGFIIYALVFFALLVSIYLTIENFRGFNFWETSFILILVYLVIAGFGFFLVYKIFLDKYGLIINEKGIFGTKWGNIKWEDIKEIVLYDFSAIEKSERLIFGFGYREPGIIEENWLGVVPKDLNYFLSNLSIWRKIDFKVDKFGRENLYFLTHPISFKVETPINIRTSEYGFFPDRLFSLIKKYFENVKIKRVKYKIDKKYFTWGKGSKENIITEERK